MAYTELERGSLMGLAASESHKSAGKDSLISDESASTLYF